jgi:hypothetical protein
MLTKCGSIHQKVEGQIDKFVEKKSKAVLNFKIWNTAMR